MSVRQFNQRAASLDHTVVLCISADLPFAQQRFCGAEGIDKVVMLSMMRDRHFAKDYGVLLEDGPPAGLTADRKSTRLNSSPSCAPRMPPSACKTEPLPHLSPRLLTSPRTAPNLP